MKDGHVHSPYCPHGTKDGFDEYINNAIRKGLNEISFTDHIPLPSMPIKEDLFNNCALSHEDTKLYINDIELLKEKYENKIKINLGFEVDYIEGLEEEIIKILNKYGEYIEDSILSVHFVKYNGEYRCIDMLDDFEYLLDKLGSLEKVYDLYYLTLLKSLKSDLGKFKPRRVGHPTLVRKFALKYPHEYKNVDLLKEIVNEIVKNNYEVDFNSAGIRKELCGEKYPSGLLFDLINEANIKLVNGSDSHDASTVGDFIE